MDLLDNNTQLDDTRKVKIDLKEASESNSDIMKPMKRNRGRPKGQELSEAEKTSRAANLARGRAMKGKSKYRDAFIKQAADFYDSQYAAFGGIQGLQKIFVPVSSQDTSVKDSAMRVEQSELPDTPASDLAPTDTYSGSFNAERASNDSDLNVVDKNLASDEKVVEDTVTAMIDRTYEEDAPQDIFSLDDYFASRSNNTKAQTNGFGLVWE